MAIFENENIILSDNGEAIFQVRRNKKTGSVFLGGRGDRDWRMLVCDSNNATTLQITGKTGGIQCRNIEVAGGKGLAIDKKKRVRLGGEGVAGHLALYPSAAQSGDVKTFGKASIWLDGEKGDILLRNADCAEDFDIREPELVEPGSVMVIGEDERLTLCEAEYDRRVAGIISGAGRFRPGLVLDRQPEREGRLPLAVVGKVECRVTAEEKSISIGDLLTTSSIAGLAMKATDRDRAFGAVIGKALTGLESGRGRVSVLVALQ